MVIFAEHWDNKNGFWIYARARIRGKMLFSLPVWKCWFFEHLFWALFVLRQFVFICLPFLFFCFSWGRHCVLIIISGGKKNAISYAFVYEEQPFVVYQDWRSTWNGGCLCCALVSWVWNLCFLSYELCRFLFLFGVNAVVIVNCGLDFESNVTKSLLWRRKGLLVAKYFFC